jgi:uncharacterized membrane protein/mono/diheme cytochrome c family protein
MQSFLGPFHPVLVHLPIGILLLACLFQWLVVKEQYKKLEPAIGISLFWGMLFAILACITGFMLSQTGDYEGDLVDKHLWFGIAVAVVSVVQYYLYRKSINAGFAKWIALILALLITITGHLGGSLTHGSDYLSKAISGESEQKFIRKPIADVQAAKAYDDVIKPILAEKCYTCHGPNKQKGKLRLDQPDLIVKGGKEGNTLISGDPSKSELIKRLLLPRNEEHHMPPKEKPQLSESEIALLHWWVEAGASFSKQVNELEQNNKIKPMLLALQVSEQTKMYIPDIPAKEIDKAPEEAIGKIRKRGILVLPVAANSNYLSVNFVSTDTVKDKDLELLLPVKDNILWLKLSDRPIGDSAMKVVSQFKNLRRLHLDSTRITDSAFHYIAQLQNLTHLNLVGTRVTGYGLNTLKGLRNLKAVYLYQTKITADQWADFRKSAPAVLIDTGGYRVPTLESDTALVEDPNARKNIKKKKKKEP